ncbi:Vacuolar protein sorting-associated protein 41 [Apophysomyces ossiformis]|uniref:Vacuolar protein sorting-associated protein 41 n=1 Tax=Apophysomyces ossiformis TaxID=679940 RepID=A0A8H7EQT4_9FUNG|nr:Vacuolar protein sorting-associated protein 41 [Apophysomyces ossiformis]
MSHSKETVGLSDDPSVSGQTNGADAASDTRSGEMEYAHDTDSHMETNENEDEQEEDEDGGEDEYSDIGSEEEEEDDEDDDLEEEPKLRYRRVGAGVRDLLSTDTASTLRVSGKFVALGTHWGAVHILDFEGNVIKSFRHHAATVNDISIDSADEFVASASDDGKVFIYALYTSEVQHFNFRRPVKAVALDPGYARKSTRQFVSGGMAEQLIMSEKGWLGQKDIVLHANEGPIYSIQWRGNFIAWANDSGVKMYDTTTNLRITYIDRPSGSPRADLYKCRMCWKNDTTLLIGWADTVKIAVVKEKAKQAHSQGQPAHFVEIISMVQTDYIICGIAPFNDTLILLAYITEDDFTSADADSQNPESQRKRLAAKPELHILNDDNEEISADVLALQGYEHYQPNDYVLQFLMEEDMFYIMGPKDVIAARSRDQDDHIEWLLDHERYGEALQAARDAEAHGGSKRFDVHDIGQTYLDWLVKEKQFDEAAKECKHVLANNKPLWEDWVFKFTEMGELKAIAPYIPMKDPQLSSTVYEIVLAWFLKSDQQASPTWALLKTIHLWPRTLYNISNVIVAVEDYLPKDKDNEILLECLADLYTYNSQPDKAIEYNLRLRRPNAFELIQEYNMFDAVKDKAYLLMEFDEYLIAKEQSRKHDNAEESGPPKKATQMPAVQLLVQNTDAIQPKKVVRQIYSNRKFLHIYLDALFDRDHHLGYEYHDIQASDYADTLAYLTRKGLLQVELYAEYDYPKLLDFLRASHYISLEKAYKTCEQKDLVPEMVYMLGRMGDNKKALMLIIERLGDVQRAIDFAKEQKDNELWEDLLTYSMDKPGFIRALLENVGTDIEPLRLIKRIPDQLEIPGLKDALLKILQDYNLQMSLHQGCEKILVSDSVFLADRMYKIQKRGINCDQNMLCSICDEEVFEDEADEELPNSIIFFCRHAYHERCLLDRKAPEITDTIHPGTLTTKVNHAALLKSTQNDEIAEKSPTTITTFENR